jgi:hypothetical protein
MNWKQDKEKFIQTITNQRDINAFDSGIEFMRQQVLSVVKNMDTVNAENIKPDPRLAGFLLLELYDTIQTLGEKK